MNKIEEIVKEKLQQTQNDHNLSTFIMEYLGDNICDRCYNHSDRSLTFVASFTDRIRYDFKAKKNVNIVFKKYCEQCLRCKAHRCPMYVEIQENEALYL